MKKILFKRYYMFFIFLLLFASRLLFSNNSDYYNEIINQRLAVINGVKKIKEKGPQTIFADVFSADEFLKQLSVIDVRNITNLNLFFPDVTYIDEYIEEVSKKVGRINIYLYDELTEYKHMKNRDYITYQMLKINKKVEKLENVRIFRVDIDEKEILDIFIDSLTKQIFDSGYYKKHIENKGEK